MKRIGVLGGTFDPLHMGHLVMAEVARDRCDLDEVLFVPSGVPPHKDADIVSAGRDRYIMALLATLTHPQFSVDRTDLDRTGPSFTVDTLSHLRNEFKECQCYFIMGADSLLDLPNWHQPDRLLRENEIIVASRPGWRLEAAERILGSLYTEHRDRIHIIEIPGIDLSSREIRSKIARGESVRYLVPDLVLSYIDEHGLYR